MKILMVCLGNICRSPLAHGIMEHLAKEKGLDWKIDSAGTGGWHTGEAPDVRSVKVAQSHGIDISAQRARQFEPADFENFDQILVMDRENLKNVLSLASNELEQQKVKLLLGNDIVPDPYWDNNLFEPVFQLVEQGCRNFIEQRLSAKD
jgi:protein-tyrosine phosphatase